MHIDSSSGYYGRYCHATGPRRCEKPDCTGDLGGPRDFSHFGSYGYILLGGGLHQEHPGTTQNPKVAQGTLKERFGAKQAALLSALISKLQLTSWDGSGAVRTHSVRLGPGIRLFWLHRTFTTIS